MIDGLPVTGPPIPQRTVLKKIANSGKMSQTMDDRSPQLEAHASSAAELEEGASSGGDARAQGL